ncbi:MAG: NapC/NirT family cytochrome c [Hyphomicrobiaceae bacterium]|nr:NapC/NirT family cytochrome c [Hyphomicrobiaceae bacterium]
MTDRDTGADGATHGEGGFLARLWKKLWTPAGSIALGTLLIGGFVAGIAFWGAFNWSLELTNTETFCRSCHEMENNVFEEYRTTIHYSNKSGVRASCPDCHVPREWVHKIARKIRASNELYHHFLGTVSTREKFQAKRLHLATNEWRRMKSTDSRECRNCHKFDYMDYSAQEPRASRIHQEALTGGKTCIDCHRGIAHQLPPNADEAYQKLVESMASKDNSMLTEYLKSVAPAAHAGQAGH